MRTGVGEKFQQKGEKLGVMRRYKSRAFGKSVSDLSLFPPKHDEGTRCCTELLADLVTTASCGSLGVVSFVWDK